MWWRKKARIATGLAALKNRDEDIRRQAAEALGMLGDKRAVEALNLALADHAWTVRREAAEALGKIGNPRAVEALNLALEDEDWTVRKEAALALGKIRDVRAITPLIQALEDQEWEVRKAVAEALGEIGLPAVNMLIEALNNDAWDWAIRREVALALGQIKNPRAVQPLMHVLANEQAGVIRWMVIWALGEIGDARAVKPLIIALGDENADVRENAALTLDKLGWKPQNAVEHVYYFFAKKEWAKCKTFGATAVQPLLRALADEDWHIQVGAVQALGVIGDVRALEPLTTLLQDEEWYHQEIVVASLKQIYAAVSGVLFQSDSVDQHNQPTTILNPEVSELTFPMSHLANITIHTDTYDFHLVERFVTYAVNYIGQKHLKKHVEVHIYGNPDKLHANLLNSFKNLCKRVDFH